MSERLVVVLGAGASADCVTQHVSGVDDTWRPPLVRELFAARYAAVLNRYPLAQFAAADIRRLDDTYSIEQFLRERYAPGTTDLMRRKFLSVPLYLQELLLRVSVDYTPHPDNYDLLISYALDDVEMDVLFVTLNYDLLLDRRLSTLSPLDTLDAYIDASRGWSLIKLHVSVDWGRIVTSHKAPDFRNPPGALDYGEAVHLARGPMSGVGASSLDDFRRREVPPHGIVPLFPALSVPLGEEDELACPENHASFLTSQIQAASGIHLLVVGYSGIDLEVLNLLKKTDTPIRTTCVVNVDERNARRVLQRLADQLARSMGATFLWNSTFGGFVQRDGWDQFREHMARHSQNSA